MGHMRYMNIKGRSKEQASTVIAILRFEYKKIFHNTDHSN